jgi:nucleoid DNA-binding protein
MGNKQTLIDRLVLYEGYTNPKALQIVNALLNAMKRALGEGRSVQIEGLGELVVFTHKQKRRIERNLKNQVASLRSVPRKPKTVKLRSRIDLSYKEK